jgi:hypothetical protein
LYIISIIICHLCGTIKRVESDCFTQEYKKVEIKKKITTKIIVSLVILKSNPPKYKENSGRVLEEHFSEQHFQLALLVGCLYNGFL